MPNEVFRQARVVVIDDVQANLRLLESSLRTMGLGQVHGFSDSALGLEWLQQNPWDLLLLDLDMPAPDGFAILQALSERDRTAQQVILVTALGDAASRRRGLDLGGNDYLTKPVDLPELLLRVRNCLQLSYAHRQLEQERAAMMRNWMRATLDPCSFERGPFGERIRVAPPARAPPFVS